MRKNLYYVVFYHWQEDGKSMGHAYVGQASEGNDIYSTIDYKDLFNSSTDYIRVYLYDTRKKAEEVADSLNSNINEFINKITRGI